MSHQSDLIATDIHAYLAQHERKDLLRFLTCGNVDDGKSTLIGRLLHDSKLIYEDQLAAVKADSVRYGTTGDVDLALLVDGLQAEREQGITIDVAYRYFSTAKRKFIIADTPGHEQYTRNMATGASTCDLAIILVDARNGVQTQTRRHSFIVSLLGIRHIVVAVNKMDLLGYSEEAFEAIKKSYLEFAGDLELGDIQFIPLSALKGDNVVTPGVNMPWYAGATLMHFLENVALSPDRNLTDLRFPVQFVNRPTPDFRGYSGTIVSGVLRAGDEVMVLPSHKTNRVKSIVTFDGEKAEAFAPMAVTLTLEKETDVGRGDMLVHPDNLPHVGQRFEAMVVWMAEDPLMREKHYYVKHSTRLVNGIVREIRHRVNVNTLAHESAAQLALNEIAHVRVELDQAVAFDSYRKNRATGAFIFVDRMTNATVGAGMILDREATDAPGTSAEGDALNFEKLLYDLLLIETLLCRAITKLDPRLGREIILKKLRANAAVSLDELLATYASLVSAEARLEAEPLVGLRNALTGGVASLHPEKFGTVPVEAVLEMTGEWFDRQLQLTSRTLDRLR